MIELMFANVICQQFEKTPGRNQQPLWQKMPEDHIPKALLISFKTRINDDIEEGYRYWDLLVYGPANYVQVWTRERWKTIELEDMEDAGDDDGEMVPKRGKNYETGATEWKMHTDHDSCWRDRIQNLIFDNRKNLMAFDSLEDWYKVIPVPKELEELYKAERKKRGYG